MALLGLALERLSGSRWRLVRYVLVGQRVPEGCLLPERLGRSIEIKKLYEGHPALDMLPRSEQTYRYRFEQGAVCLAAFRKGQPAGFIWFIVGAYEEDEVQSRFVPLPEGQAAWDFDIYVAPEHRLSGTFLRLWDAAFACMREQGVQWTVSRISVFNPVSVGLHRRLGAIEVGRLGFLCLGKLQIMTGCLAPRFRISQGRNRRPEFRIDMGARCREDPSSKSITGVARAIRVVRWPHEPVVGRRLLPAPSEGTLALPPAVVVGLCAHGLACVRSLARAGVRVYALEARSSLPGCRTRKATVVKTEDINGPGIVAVLREFAATYSPREKPVLFLTNDNMVRHVAQGWSELEGLYALSWSARPERILSLLDKADLEIRCRDVGLQYPQTAYVSAETMAEQACARFDRFPLIVKPARPLSGFKAKRIESADDLRALCRQFSADLPFLLQEYVPGGDNDIYFVALYLRHDRTVATFTGRKLASHPPAMGQATAAESFRNDNMVALAEQFFRGAGVSGAAALEFKVDQEGTAWVIEPTVGRTEYCVDCCIANGVDLPWIQYCDQMGWQVPDARQQNRRIWLDAERDPRILLDVTRRIGVSGWMGRLPRFTYWNWSDPMPGMVAVRDLVRSRLKKTGPANVRS